MRNDSAIGTDLIAKTQSDGWQLPYERYPFAKCELGGGIEVTHHRRPIIKPMDCLLYTSKPVMNAINILKRDMAKVFGASDENGNDIHLKRCV